MEKAKALLNRVYQRYLVECSKEEIEIYINVQESC